MQVSVWDVRHSRRSQELLGPRNLSKLCQVQVCPDGHVIIAGTTSGHVRVPATEYISCPIPPEPVQDNALL